MALSPEDFVLLVIFEAGIQCTPPCSNQPVYHVLKSDFHIARASWILIFEMLEMVCNGLQTAGEIRFDLTSGQLESVVCGL